MELDEFLSKRPQSLLAQLVKEDLDPLSVDELDTRMAVLQAEIARVQAKKAAAKDVRSLADGLFKK